MSTLSARAATASPRALRILGLVAAAMWIVMMIVTDGIQQGTTRNLITNAASAAHTVSQHGTAVLVEGIGSCYLAVILVVFAVALRRALGDTVAAAAAAGAGVMSAVAIMLGAAVTLAELAAVHHHDDRALLTLGYLVAFAWAWEGASWGFLLLATGYALLSSRIGPKWFAITTIVVGVPVVLGPGAVLFWGLAPLWFGALGFLLTRRPRRDETESTMAVDAEPVASVGR